MSPGVYLYENGVDLYDFFSAPRDKMTHLILSVWLSSVYLPIYNHRYWRERGRKRVEKGSKALRATAVVALVSTEMEKFALLKHRGSWQGGLCTGLDSELVMVEVAFVDADIELFHSPTDVMTRNGFFSGRRIIHFTHMLVSRDCDF